MFAQSKIRSIAAAGAAALAIAGGFAGAASAQEGPFSQVVGCDAPGHSQATGAVLGAILGAVAGNSMSRGDRGAGTTLGALVGAGAGSWMGCKVQRDQAQARYDGYADARYEAARDPYAYRRAVIEQRRREREAAEYRVWRARYDERGYDQGYGRYGY